MSNQALLLLPVFGMVFLTIGIGLWMLKLRYKAVIEDGVSAKYFKLNRGAKLPDYLVQVTQHYENLFETPVIFYVGIVLVLLLQINDSGYVLLSWGFFVSRLLHAYMHTLSNRLKYRKNAFIVTFLFLAMLWIRLLIDTLGL
ncbi:MAG: MAPEG family protein [Cocleimonas sp.]